MNRLVIAAGSVAAVVLIAALGIGLAAGGGMFGPGAAPSPSPTPSANPTEAPTPTVAPTPTPVPTPTPIADPETGPMEPGTYVAHPFEPPNDGISFTYVVPSDSWESFLDDTGTIFVLREGNSQGLGMGFERISSLNGDPCHGSGTADDVAIGPTVDDLVAGLTASSEYETSAPTGVSLGGYSGQHLVVTMPNYEGSECDGEGFMIWNHAGNGFNLPAFGPGNRWTLWILDVEGERVVIRLSDFEDSPADLREELQSMVESIEITAQ